MKFNDLIEPNKVLTKVVGDQILAWTEIDSTKAQYKRAWYLTFLNMLPLPVRFYEKTTVGVLALTDQHLHQLYIGSDKRIYKGSRVFDRSLIENCEVIKQKNEWQKDIVLFYDGEKIKFTIHNYPGLYKYNIGLQPEDAEAQDFVEMSDYLIDELSN